MATWAVSSVGIAIKKTIPLITYVGASLSFQRSYLTIHIIHDLVGSFDPSETYASQLGVLFPKCGYDKNKPPMWEWFIPTIYGDLEDGFVIVIPTLYENKKTCSKPPTSAA